MKDSDSLENVRQEHNKARQAFLAFIGDKTWRLSNVLKWACWEFEVDESVMQRAFWALAADGEIVLSDDYRVSKADPENPPWVYEA